MIQNGKANYFNSCGFIDNRFPFNFVTGEIIYLSRQGQFDPFGRISYISIHGKPSV